MTVCDLFLAATLFCIPSSLARTAAYISHSESEMKSAGCEKSLLTHSSIMPKEPLTIKVYVVFNVKSSKPGYFCRHSFVMSCLFISQHLSKNCLLPYLPNNASQNERSASTVSIILFIRGKSLFV